MKKYISLLALFCSTPVFAYIDPGSGSAIMSAIVGIFVAIGITIKTYWYKLKGLFAKSKAEKADQESEQNK
ncbi:hypothetical protein [Vibrio hepatarius]|uniref:hypothetical protein n=1 Tax=Vibrio hepatarius TaxID=171383 RepID=UPI001C09E61C|nr:hypothetical protein [Vibrio hepatarius]MBU2895093.1 hypothetical protein [Vibrio hepatarius]